MSLKRKSPPWPVGRIVPPSQLAPLLAASARRRAQVRCKYGHDLAPNRRCCVCRNAARRRFLTMKRLERVARAFPNQEEAHDSQA